MNEVILKGKLRNIQYSHTIGDIEYCKAELIVARSDKDEDDIINIKFKKFSNLYKDGDDIELIGNIRTYSYQLDNGKNKVEVYVFTYLDTPDIISQINNRATIDGRICKINDMQFTKSGKQFIRFIVANNIMAGNRKFNVYIPCIAYGKNAIIINNKSINDKILLSGELHSHTYKKISGDEIEFKVAHDITVLEVN